MASESGSRWASPAGADGPKSVGATSPTSETSAIAEGRVGADLPGLGAEVLAHRSQHPEPSLRLDLHEPGGLEGVGAVHDRDLVEDACGAPESATSRRRRRL